MPDSNDDEDETVVTVSLHGEGDWMHPPEDDEGSGYSRDGDMTEEEVEAELQRLEERKQRRREEREDDAHKPSDEHENWWSRELASMSSDPGNMEESIYAEPLLDMDDFREDD